MKSPLTKKRLGNLSRGILLTTLLTATGCASLQRSGYGVVKSVDGAARIVTGASVGEKVGIYSTDQDAPNYKSPEEYNGRGIKDRLFYTLTSPVLATRQFFQGIGDILGGVHGALEQGANYSVQKVPYLREGVASLFRIIDPDTKRGIFVPTLERGLNELEEKVGNVKTDSEERAYTEERTNSLGGATLNLIPAVNHLGDERIGWGRRIENFLGEIVYWFIPGKSNSSSDGGSSGGIPGVPNFPTSSSDFGNAGAGAGGN